MYNFNQIPSEAQVKKYIRRILFGKNVFCPECRSRKVLAEKNRYRCVDCQIGFSVVPCHSICSGLLAYSEPFSLLNVILQKLNKKPIPIGHR